MSILRYILLALTVSIIAACGGGGGGGEAPPASRTATLKLSTTGTPSANLAGIGITITLPDGVTPALNADGTVAATVVTVSGVAAPGTVLAPIYTPASGTTKGTLRFAMASSIASGFGAGEYATVVLSVAGGANPVQGDFALSEFNPIDVMGQVATGLTATVASLAIS